MSALDQVPWLHIPLLALLGVKVVERHLAVPRDPGLVCLDCTLNLGRVKQCRKAGIKRTASLEVQLSERDMILVEHLRLHIQRGPLAEGPEGPLGVVFGELKFARLWFGGALKALHAG